MIRGIENWVHICDSASSVDCFTVSSRLSGNKNHFSGEFYRCDSSASGLKRLLDYKECFCCVLFIDTGGLISCSMCFGSCYSLTDEQFLSAWLRCVTVINATSADKMSLWPQEIVLSSLQKKKNSLYDCI